MDLPGENKPACSHEAGDDTPVCGNIFLGITNTEADIQTCKGRLAISGVAGKDPVIDPATGGQIFKLIKRYAVLSRKYHLISPSRRNSRIFSIIWLVEISGTSEIRTTLPPFDLTNSLPTIVSSVQSAPLTSTSGFSV